MKNIPIIAFLAALAAFAFSSLSFETAGSLLFGAGLVSVLAADYSRRARLGLMRTAPVEASPSPAHVLGLAA